MIRAWWEKWPQANIGLHVGKASLAVLDIDPRNGGDASLEKLLNEHGRQWLSSIQVCTGGGGWHYYYAMPDEAQAPAILAPGIDLKRGNGYVLAPPSIHPNGTPYTFSGGGLLDGELDFAPPLPEWCTTSQSRNLIEVDDWAASIRSRDPESPENVARVQSALAHLSADCGRDEWRNVGFALLSTYWDCAENLFRTWSLTAPHRFDENGFRNVVESATDKPNGIALGTLFSMAAASGWQDPRKAERSIETYGDISNGRRFAERFRGRLLYCHGNGTWYQWDAQRWARCEKGEAVAAAKRIAEECFDEASGALWKESSDWAKRNFSQALAVHRSASRLENMLKCACSEAGMSIANPGLFDSDPWKLGVRNGVLDLRTGTLIDDTPDMLISRQAGTHYDFQAECPRWRQFLTEVCNRDEDMAAFLQRVCGYALTGSVTEEKLFFMFGTGANGKSVFANIVAAVFGEYAVTVRAALLARDPRGTGSDAEREKARLPGARLALVNETGQADLWDDQKVKEITSRERISARYLHQESFDFMPTHKLFIRGNHQPGAMDSSDGFWRRMVLIGFTRQFSESERVPDLDSRIIDTELPGVLAWMVEGCIRWQHEGLQVPDRMQAAVDAYRRDTDLLGEWLRLHCIISPQAETPVSTLFHSYERFLRDGNMKPPSRSAFGRQLVSRGYKRRESNSQSLYSGLTLRESVVWGLDDDDL
jgi:P4 family phage/plasmid primase-like protien